MTSAFTRANCVTAIAPVVLSVQILSVIVSTIRQSVLQQASVMLDLYFAPHTCSPALATDDGILTETPAMLAYVAQIFPAAVLAPVDDPFRFAQAQAFNSFLCSTLHVAHAHRMRGYRWADDEAAIASMQRKVPQSVAANFELIEKYMFKGPWVMGDTYTICDPYLFTIAQWMEADGVDPAQFPMVAAHRSRMAARPAVIKAIRQELA